MGNRGMGPVVESSSRYGLGNSIEGREPDSLFISVLLLTDNSTSPIAIWIGTSSG